MQARDLWTLSVLTLALAAFMTGCDSAGDEAAVAASGGQQVGKAVSADVAPTMVKAVSAGEGATSVEVKFELTQRPEVGKPVDITLALIPTARLERLFARFQPGEGLELTQGEQTDQIARPVIGSPINHTLTVVPKRDGIFTIRAIVLTDSETESVSRNFSIPLIAGSGLPEWRPKQTVARGDRARPLRSNP